MVAGASNHGQGKATPSALKSLATVSYASRAPRTTGYSSMARRQGESKAQEASYERTSRIKNEHKSGCYEQYTTKEKVSSRDFYKDRGSGQVGVKDEYKRSSIVKIGDKRGYTEYYNEEKVGNFSSGNQSYNYGRNKQLPTCSSVCCVVKFAVVTGASNHGQGKATPSAPKPSTTVSYASHTPRTTGYSSMARRQGESKAQEASYKRTSRIKNEHKSGCYEWYTTKEKVSSREFYKDRGSGQVGVKDEYKRSSTVKIGDKRGYTEYYNEEKVRNFSFGNQSYNYGRNKQLPAYNKDYDSDGRDELQGNGCDSDGSNNIYNQAYSDDGRLGSYSDQGQSYDNGCDYDGRYSDGGQSYSNGYDDECRYNDGGQSYSNGCDDDGSYSDGGQSYSNGCDDDGSYSDEGQSYGNGSDDDVSYGYDSYSDY